MLARADLRERPDARPGLPRREATEAPDGPLPPCNRANDILIRSGELTVGLLSRSTHGPETWSDPELACRGPTMKTSSGMATPRPRTPRLI